MKRALDRKSHASCWIWPEDGRLSLGCEAWPWTSDFTPRVPFLTGCNRRATCLTGCVRMAGAEKGDACETLRCCRSWSFPGNAHIVYHFEVCYCFLETEWLLSHSLTSDLPVTSHSYQHSGTFEKIHDYGLKWQEKGRFLGNGASAWQGAVIVRSSEGDGVVCLRSLRQYYPKKGKGLFPISKDQSSLRTRV